MAIFLVWKVFIQSSDVGVTVEFSKTTINSARAIPGTRFSLQLPASLRASVRLEIDQEIRKPLKFDEDNHSPQESRNTGRVSENTIVIPASKLQAASGVIHLEVHDRHIAIIAQDIPNGVQTFNALIPIQFSQDDSPVELLWTNDIAGYGGFWGNRGTDKIVPGDANSYHLLRSRRWLRKEDGTKDIHYTVIHMYINGE